MNMIEFIKEAGMAALWLMLGLLVVKRNERKDESND
jgi:hypothetical protein